MVRNEPILCPRCQSDDIFSRGETCICGSCGFKFQIPKEEKPFQPVKLFLSYGHKEAIICRLINQALNDRGHTTWFDEDKLHQGQDWRQKITGGLTGCNGVISCLSRHSVRDPGVCLNEQSIAIGVRGGNIKTILLEPEKEVRPSASLCHVQWLDMSDWQRWYSKGESVFRPWFDAKMAQLFQVIESDESREFTGQISVIQEKLHINYSTSKQRNLLQHLFVGREWLTEQLERWLDDPEGPRLCILYGDPGVGKSAFAANYIHYNPRVAAGLFCEYDRPIYNDAVTVVMTLSYLLACRLPAYRTALVAILEREKRLGMMSASELFDLLLAEPLTTLTIDGGHETLCVVIDGLDECGQGEYNALAEVLARYVPRLPAWLRVLVTSREVAAVKAPLARAFTLELHGDSPQNREDVRRYFVERLTEHRSSDPAWDYALDALAERSGGIFLYAQLVCEGIQAGKISIHDADSFPDGLSDAFYQWFGWFFPDDREYKADFRLPLGMLLAAPEPLPTEELKRIFEWDNNRMGDFLRRIDVLLRHDVDNFGKTTITFTHLYLNEWLDTEQAGRFRSDRATALERMAERFYVLFQKDVKALTEYESLHLADLLEQCGNTAALEEVTLNYDLFWNIIDAGEYGWTWGKLPAALVCYEQTCAMAERMTQERNTPEDRSALSFCYGMVAKILVAKGDPDGALKLYQKSLGIFEQLVQERNTPDDRRGLSANYSGIASILWAKDDSDRALELQQKSLEITEQLVRERGTPEDRWNLSASYHNVANILRIKGDLDRALELHQKGLEIAKQLVREQDTPKNRRNLGTSYDGVALVLEAKGNLDGALKLYQKSLKIFEQLVREWDTPDNRGVLSFCCTMVAGILKAKGDLDGALKLYQKSLEILEQLVRERGKPDDRRNLGASYYNVTDILRIKGDLDRALELQQKGLEIAEQLVRERGTPGDRRILYASYDNVADILRAKSDLDGALELYQKSLEIFEQLVRERRKPDDRWNLGASYYNVADILRIKGDLDGALELHQKSLEIFEQLVRERGKPDERWNLGASYYNVADILRTKGDLDGALDLYQKSLEIWEQLVVRERNTPNDRRDLSVGYTKVADILRDKGDLDGALELYQKSLEIHEQLVQERGTVSDYDDLAVFCYNLAVLHLPLSASKRLVYDKLAYAKLGLELSKQLFKTTGQDRYQNFCRDFKRLFKTLKAFADKL